jgi:hypothetical protein
MTCYEGGDGVIKCRRVFAGNGVRGVRDLYAHSLGKALFQLIHDAMKELRALNEFVERLKHFAKETHLHTDTSGA